MSILVFDLFKQPMAKSFLKLSAGDGVVSADFKTVCYPDTELNIQIRSNVAAKDLIVFASLDCPNAKILELLFFCDNAKELGARSLGLICPYLPYMRQDKHFVKGDALTSKTFARLLSNNFDWMLTVDPHLHRYKNLDEIYSIPTQVVHAERAIAKWIKSNINLPLIIGPDAESEQWAKAIAELSDSAPYVVLEKVRKSATDVKISIPDLSEYRNYTPVIVDDIISSGHTIIETAKQLTRQNMISPVCIAVHALFADMAYEKIMSSGISQIITCNTIEHPSNIIDLAPEIYAKYVNFSV